MCVCMCVQTHTHTHTQDNFIVVYASFTILYMYKLCSNWSFTSYKFCNTFSHTISDIWDCLMSQNIIYSIIGMFYDNCSAGMCSDMFRVILKVGEETWEKNV